MLRKCVFQVILVIAISAMVLAAIPSYIPVYPKAKIVEQSSEEGYGMAHLLVSGSKKAVDVANWYEPELKKRGWQNIERIDEDMDYAEFHAVYPKKNLFLNLNISASDDGGVEILCEWGVEE